MRSPINYARWSRVLFNAQLAIFGLMIGVMIGSMTASAATEPRAYMPVIKNGQAPVARLVTLVDTDAGFVTAATIPNTSRVIVAYTDRRDGNRLKIGEHVGDTIKPLPDPLTLALAAKLFGDVLPKPSFSYPGEKQGFGMPVFVAGEMRIYATSRDEGDPDGPFKVKVLIAPIPAPQ